MSEPPVFPTPKAAKLPVMASVKSLGGGAGQSL
jgi:hypothetical protein